jgi:pimeloyl-ACP methyl ester carboxylesterase
LEGDNYRVLMYDLIGRGMSDFPSTNSFDGAVHVAQLRRLITNLQSQRANLSEKYHIIAHSMGGAVAALYASQYPDEVRSVVFLSPAGLMDAGFFRFIRSCCGCMKNFVRSGQSGDKIVRGEFTQHKGKALEYENEEVRLFDLTNASNPRQFDAFWGSAMQFPLFGLDNEVKAIGAAPTISTMVMWGKKDGAVSFRPNFERWKKYLGTPSEADAGSSTVTVVGDKSGSNTKKIVDYTVYDDLAHAFFLERPDEVHGDILAFLGRVEERNRLQAADNTSV